MAEIRLGFALDFPENCLRFSQICMRRQRNENNLKNGNNSKIKITPDRLKNKDDLKNENEKKPTNTN